MYTRTLRSWIGLVGGAILASSCGAQDVTPPTVPAGLVVTELGHTSLVLSWTASTDNVGVTAYEVWRNGSPVWSGGATSVSQTGLSQLTVYQYSVRARDAAGNWSAFSAMVNVRTWQRLYSGSGTLSTYWEWDEDLQMDVPHCTTDWHNITVQPTGGLFRIGTSGSTDTRGMGWFNGSGSWEATGGGLAGNFLTTVVVPFYYYSYMTYVGVTGEFDETTGGYQLVVDYKPTSTPTAVFSTSPSFGRSPFQVNVDGASSNSPFGPLSFGWDFDNNGTTDATGVTASTTLSTAGPTANRTIFLKVTDADGTIATTTRTVTVYPANTWKMEVDGGTTDVPFQVAGAAVTLTANAPVAGQQFAGWTVASGSGTFGNSSASTTQFTMAAADTQVRANYVADVTPPSVPGGVAALDVAHTSLTLSWTPATDNVGITLYEVWRDGVPVWSGTATSVTQTGLSQLTVYQFCVRAKDAAGNWSALSPLVSTRTWQRLYSGSGTISTYWEWDEDLQMDVPHCTTNGHSFWVQSTGGLIRIGTSGNTDTKGMGWFNGSGSWEATGGGLAGNFMTTVVVPSYYYSYMTYVAVTGETDETAGGYQVFVDFKPVNVPAASFVASPVLGRTPVTVGFNASASTSAYGPISGYAWDFDNNGSTDATGVSVSRVLTNPGGSPAAQTVKLSVTDIDGSIGTTTREVIVYPANSKQLVVEGGTTSIPFLTTSSAATITAAPPSVAGQAFLSWTLVSGTGTITNPNGRVTSFIAGSSDAVIRANYGPDVTPPSIPGTVIVGRVTATEAYASWNESTDDVGVTAYEVFNGDTLVATTSTRNVTLTGLTPGTLYQFKVRAVDAAGLRSEPSGAAVAFTWQRLLDTSGTIETDGEGNGTSVTFQFNINAGGSVKIYTTGTTATQGTLAGPSYYGTVSGGGGNFSMTQQLGSGAYSITVSGLTGDTSGDFGIVVEYGIGLYADFSATPTSGSAPLFVTFDASKSRDPSGGTITVYQWDFDNNGSVDATGPIVTHSYGTGIYTVRLTVINNADVVGTITRKIVTQTANITPFGIPSSQGASVVPAPSASPNTALVGTQVAVSTPAKDTADMPFHAWFNGLIEDVHNTSAVLTVSPWLTMPSANYWSTSLQQPVVTHITASTSSAATNEVFTINASSTAPSGRTLSWDSIAYSTDFGQTWIEGTLAAGTKWQGTAPTHQLSCTFSFSNPGWVFFRAWATPDQGSTSYPSYVKVLVRTPEESDLVTVVNGFGTPESGPAGTVISLRPMPGLSQCWWEILSGAGSFSNPSWPWAIFTKGAGSVLLRANPGSPIPVIMVRGQTNRNLGSPGSECLIVADPPTSGQVFERWVKTGDGTLLNENLASTSFIIGNSVARLEATYRSVAAPSAAIAASSFVVNTGSEFAITATGADPDADLALLTVDYSLDEGKSWVLGSTVGVSPALDPTRWAGAASEKTMSPRFRISSYHGTRVRFRARAEDAAQNFSRYAYVDVFVTADKPAAAISAWFGEEEALGTLRADEAPVLTVAASEEFTIKVRGVSGRRYLTELRLDVAKDSEPWREGTAADNRLWWSDTAGVETKDMDVTCSAAELGVGTVRFRARATDTHTGDYRYVTVKIVAAAGPPVIDSQPVGKTARLGESHTFSVAASGKAPLSYRWRKNGSDIAGATVRTFTIPAAQLADAGSYSVQVANSIGNVNSANAALGVNQSPVASFAATPTSGQAPVSVAFNALASYDQDGTIVGYHWDFGDGKVGTGPTVSHTYYAIGTAANYTAKLTVTDNHGVTATTTRTIAVTPVPGGGADTDGDGIPDAWEAVHNVSDPLADPDQDGWSNVAEYNRGTDPNSSSSPGPSALGDGPLDDAWPAADQPGAYVGFTPGVAGVDLSGAATYSVPIKVTPGSVGVQPSLNLEYSSQGGNGYLGLGWTLRGLPVISRGPSTIATDGVAQGVTFTAQDKFYLDGSRLIAINGGTYGAPETEYRTEIDAFHRIVSYGSAGSGPAYFKMWTKSGQVLEFGATRNSQLLPGSKSEPLLWAVNKISDLNGNSILIEYTGDGAAGETDPSAEMLPWNIAYTCNGAAPAGYATIAFRYRGREDPQSGYTYDTLNRSTKLLEKITIKSGTALFRQYRLTYADGTATTPSRLRSVQEYAEETQESTKAYPATQFDYFPVAPAGLEHSNDQIQVFNGGVEAFAVDMNGDGLTDLLRVYNENAAKVELYYNDGNHFLLDANLASQQLFLDGGDFFPGGFLTTDIDGDGKGELITNPTSFYRPVGTIRRIKAASRGTLSLREDIVVTGFRDMGASLPCYSADFTGDGRDDLLLVRLGLPARAQLLVSTGSNYEPYDFTSVPGLANGRLEIGDFTGDGLPDLLAVCDEANDRRIRVFSVSTNGVTLVDETILGSKRTDWRILLADVNGDGQQDLLYLYKSANGGDQNACYAEIWTRKGHGPGGARFEKTGQQWFGGWNEAFQYVPFDYDGDRKSDVAVLFAPTTSTTGVVIFQGGGPNNTPYTQRGIDGDVYGSWFTGSAQVSRPALFRAQLNKDGLGDLLFVGFNGKTHIKRLLSKPSATEQPGAFPHLLNRVTNGMGVETKFTYLSLLEDDIFVPGTGSTWPDANLRPPFRVVSIMESERFAGQTIATAYTYGGLTFNALRGFRGFKWIKSYDSGRGLETKRGYLQAFPTTNLPEFEEVRAGMEETGGTLVSRTEYTVTTPPSSGVYAPYINSTYTKEWELDGSEVRVRFQSEERDAYGNILTSYERHAPGIVSKAQMAEGQTLAAGQFERKLSYSLYEHDTAATRWLISRPRRIEEYAKSGDFPAAGETRVTAIAYVAGSNRVDSTTQEPDNPAAGDAVLRIKKSYTYDPYGNIEKITVTSPPGAGVASIEQRETITDYSTSADHAIAGRFPKSVTDAIGQVTSFGYDSVTGLLKRRKDEATGLETTWQYDEFGSMIRENRPDNTFSTTTTRWDAAKVSMDSGADVVSKYHVDRRTSGSAPSLVRYDKNGLALQGLAVAGDGASRFSVNRYDERGNLIATARPHRQGDTAYWTKTSYDAKDRPISRIVPAPPAPDAEPNAPTASEETTWEYTGRAITEWNPRGLAQRRTSNAVGLPATVESNPDFPSTAADRAAVTYKYDGFRGLKETTDALGNTVKTTFDRLGRKTSVEDPNMGTWTYNYYANGLLRTQTDAKQTTTSYKYDKLDRLTEREHSMETGTGKRVCKWIFNDGVGPAPGGRLLNKAEVTENGTEVFRETRSYDSYSRLNGKTRKIGGVDYLFGFTYDTSGRLEATTYPAVNSQSFVTVQKYNAYGFLKEVRRRNGSDLGQIYWQASAYESDGQLREAIFGNGAVVDRIHSPENGRIAGEGVSVALQDGGVPMPELLVQSFGYDTAGNVISKGVKYTKADKSVGSYVETHFYDGMDRVQTISHSTFGSTHSYAYNKGGNITEKDGVVLDYVRTNPTEPLAPHAVRYAGGVAYSYDANGNLTGDTAGRTILWRRFNQPDIISFTTGGVTKSCKFSYGADDERIIQETQDGAKVVYVGGQFEVQGAASGSGGNSTYRAYVHTPLGRSVVLEINHLGAVTRTSYLNQDHLTAVSLVTDEAFRPAKRSDGTLEWYSYDPWGAPRDFASTTTLGQWPQRERTTRGYTDHEMLDGVRLIHMNGRIYNPTIGRFLSPDPFVNPADGPQMLNRYAYVRNNPLTLNDPSGYMTPDTVLMDPFVVSSTRVNLPDWPKYNLGVTPFSPVLTLLGGQSRVSWGAEGNSGNINSFDNGGPYNVFGFAQEGTVAVQGYIDRPRSVSEWSVSIGNVGPNMLALLHNVFAPMRILEDIVREGISALTGPALADGVMRTTVLLSGGVVGLGTKATRAAKAAESALPRLAVVGEDLFVGTFSQSYRANVRSGLNATHTAHHSLQDAVSLTSHGRGITINLRKDLHELTRTFRTPVEEGLTLRQHLARDVVDLRNILRDAGYDRSVINRQLQELILQNKAVFGFPLRQ